MEYYVVLGTDVFLFFYFTTHSTRSVAKIFTDCPKERQQIRTGPHFGLDLLQIALKLTGK